MKTLDWSPWRPLTDCWCDPELALPGLYRIRRERRPDIDYIGQTGLALRRRLAMLRGIERDQMPYRILTPLPPRCGRSGS